MELRTHLGISKTYCGTVVELAEGRAVVRLMSTAEMAADDQGLVHGGFVFGAADFAAMAAVNDPNVVLAGAECRFLKPAKVGQELLLTASVVSREGRKALVDVTAALDGAAVFQATFRCVVLDKHVLSI